MRNTKQWNYEIKSSNKIKITRDEFFKKINQTPIYKGEFVEDSIYKIDKKNNINYYIKDNYKYCFEIYKIKGNILENSFSENYYENFYKIKLTT
tara:strand:- start:563 stop:844 length:282 start_codon:yes stop_codon:yes gene_type:complete